jgi:plasmid maintenance system antidote protein VapI
MIQVSNRKPVHPSEILADILDGLEIKSEQIMQGLDVSIQTLR